MSGRAGLRACSLPSDAAMQRCSAPRRMLGRLSAKAHARDGFHQRCKGRCDRLQACNGGPTANSKRRRRQHRRRVGEKRVWQAVRLIEARTTAEGSGLPSAVAIIVDRAPALTLLLSSQVCNHGPLNTAARALGPHLSSQQLPRRSVLRSHRRPLLSAPPVCCRLCLQPAALSRKRARRVATARWSLAQDSSIKPVSHSSLGPL